MGAVLSSVSVLVFRSFRRGFSKLKLAERALVISE